MSRRPDPACGVFETLLVRSGRAQALDAHLARLERSVRDLYGLALPGDDVADIRTRLSRHEPGRGAHRARIEAQPRAERLALSLTVAGAPPRPAPVALAPVVLPGGLGAHKWRDRRLIETPGADPVPLLVDADGAVLEAAWANIWLLEGDTLVTPPADGRILPGVTRARLLELALRLGLRAREEPIALDRARAAPALVLTSSLRQATAAAFDAPPRPAPIVDRLRSALADAGDRHSAGAGGAPCAARPQA